MVAIAAIAAVTITKMSQRIRNRQQQKICRLSASLKISMQAGGTFVRAAAIVAVRTMQ